MSSYFPADQLIKLYMQEIRDNAKGLGVSVDELKRVVELHEAAHAIVKDVDLEKVRGVLLGMRVVYDATYAVLAELRGCEFWTADRVFYDAVKATLGFVKYLPDYP
jgi:hypothetical protein